MLQTLWLRISLISAGVVAADQVTKSIALAALSDPAYGDLGGKSQHLFGPFAFTLVFNPGVAFGIGSSYAKYLVLVAILVILIVMIRQRATIRGATLMGIGLVLGGALGNIADRLFREHQGRVVDFIDIWRWPVFNLADAAVVIGAFTLAFAGARSNASAGPNAEEA